VRGPGRRVQGGLGLALVLAFLFLAPACGDAQVGGDARVHLVKVGNFSAPIYVAAPPGDSSRLFVVERAGRIVVLHGGSRNVFLDIRGQVSKGGERGLLSMAFAPDYASSGRFYVDYTDNGGDIRIVEFRRSTGADRAAPGSARNVLTIEHSQFSNHNGGQIQFGPDGLLYIGVGDGGSENDPFRRGQNLGTLLGKLLRIDPRPSGGRPYTVPRSNPFAGRAGARPEIYSYGLRNPWRFSFDRQTGGLTIGDVGQDRFEEIDFTHRDGAAGRNFGWSVFEGRHRFRGGSALDYTPPVLTLSHSRGFCAVDGGYVVRDRTLRSLFGRYVYGDLCNSRLYSAKLRKGHVVGNRALPVKVGNLVSFGEDARGRVYAVSLSGSVYRLAG
jgi:glucose/arabinose dehydrogenase